MGGGPGFGPFHGMGAPAAKANDFRGSVRRLVAELRPEAPLVVVVAILAIAGVVAQVIAPRVMATATDQLFNGLVGKMLGQLMPAGTTQQQAEAILRAHGQGQVADMLSGMSVVPGVGV
ncbi:MAG TPA: ABC transporter ATP-binding protein, partial [Candidatus Dormibacteraeota bacterium]|nr:ABC transporter ATP-binding protein [Candidatus Dormibacteraeota bacterium]